MGYSTNIEKKQKKSGLPGTYDPLPPCIYTYILNVPGRNMPADSTVRASLVNIKCPRQACCRCSCSQTVTQPSLTPRLLKRMIPNPLPGTYYAVSEQCNGRYWGCQRHVLALPHVTDALTISFFASFHLSSSYRAGIAVWHYHTRVIS